MITGEGIKLWLVAYGALGLISYLLAGTGLRVLIVLVDYLSAIAATYVLFPEAYSGLQELAGKREA